jgi:hypothetical protein
LRREVFSSMFLSLVMSFVGTYGVEL